MPTNGSFVTRRRLLQYLGVVGGVAATSTVGLPPRLASAVAASGRWSDPATWGGRVPGPTDLVTVDTTVVLDADTSVAGLVVVPGGKVVFDAARSVTLSSTGNVVVRGALVARPASPAVVHRIWFTGIDEGALVGGGMEPLASDVGLWVVDDGRLELAGSTKTAWARLAVGAAAGTTRIELDRVPEGWRAGDRIVVVPTTSPTPSKARPWWTAFSESTVASSAGARVTLSQPLSGDHLLAPGGHGAEVLNLTRNVRIEGTPTGRAHLLVRSTARQSISFVGLRHVGPRRDGAKVLGRWPVHFHHCLEADRGAVFEGLVVTEAGSHAFVQHQSHGTTLRNCIAYDVQEPPFWWDDGEVTDDSTWESCVAARVAGNGLTGSGFYLGKGARNAARGCVAVGVEGADGAGIVSPSARDKGEWVVEDCLAHNNRHAGFKAYLNTDKADEKVVSRLTAYCNEVGIDHGAYLNSWRYEGFVLHANRDGGVALRAVSNAQRIVLADGTVDQFGLFDLGVSNARHVVSSTYATVFERCRFAGHRLAAVGLVVPDPDSPDLIDLVDCVFDGNELWIDAGVAPGCLVRFFDSVRGAVAARRVDQPGSLVPAWNARTSTIPSVV